MNTMLFIVAILFGIWILIQIIGTAFAAVNEWNKLRRKDLKKNYIVLNGRRYWLKVVNAEVPSPCSLCKLQDRCKRRGTDICNVFDEGGADNMIMTDEEDEK